MYGARCALTGVNESRRADILSVLRSDEVCVELFLYRILCLRIAVATTIL
jgi:hypothetical protein